MSLVSRGKEKRYKGNKVSIRKEKKNKGSILDGMWKISW